MKTQMIFPLLLALLMGANTSAQSEETTGSVQSQLTLKGWYSLVGLDFSLGFGEDFKHRGEFGFFIDREGGEFGTPAIELLYHHRLAQTGGSELFIGGGGRLYNQYGYNDFFVAVPMTYQYQFPDQPFAVRARLTVLVNDYGPFAEPNLGVSWSF